MARYVNPDLFGEDLVPLVWEAVGVGATSVVADKVVSPIVNPLVAGFTGGSAMVGKLVDAIGTGLTGWLVGEAVGMIDSPIGRRMRRGGVLLAVAKGIGAFVPGFSLSASFPTSLSLSNPLALVSGNTKALPAGNGTLASAVAAKQVPELRNQGYGSSGI